MVQPTIPENGRQLKKRLTELKDAREERQARYRKSGGRGRTALARREREEVLKKTAGRCHICCGEVDPSWRVDHVQPPGEGGSNELDNLLPAHRLCNHYKWDYFPEENQWILKIGVWARRQILSNSQLGSQIASEFIYYDHGRQRRRRY